MKRDNEGFTIRNIPSQIIRVCNGCKYHNVERMICGHDFVTDNYSCEHPDVIDGFLSTLTKGRMIAFNSRKEPNTPEWCPFLQVKREGKIL